jgi:GNAT superfamily N-acetyltransferase
LRRFLLAAKITMKENDVRIDIKSVNELTPVLASFIQRTHDREFGDDLMVYANPQWYVLGFLRDEPMAQVGVLQRTITVNQNPLLIAGVSFLITEPEYRGRGYATAIMSEAIAFIEHRLVIPFGLLTCKPRLASFYIRMGWKTIDEPNVFVQPTGNRSCGGVIMVNECGGSPWPEGKIDLCGLPW